MKTSVSSAVLCLGVMLASTGYADYQYIIDQPTRTPRISVAQSAPSALTAASRGEMKVQMSFSAVSRTHDASAGIALSSEPPRGIVLSIR